MKKVLSFAVLLSVLLCATVSTTVNADNKLANSITVKGTGSVYLVPNAYSAVFVFEERGELLTKLNDTINRDLSSVIAFLRRQGIAEKNIQAMQINLQPWYEHVPNQGRVNKGFIIQREVHVTHTAIEDYDTIIDGVIKNGVKRIQSFNFLHINDENSYQEALINAVNDAKLRASAIAEQLDVKIAGVISLNEQFDSIVQPPMAIRLREAAESKTSLPGQSEVTASVVVTFRITQKQ